MLGVGFTAKDYNPVFAESGIVVLDATNSETRRFVILISGRGSNMQALVKVLADPALKARVCAVISNRPDASGLEWARRQGLETVALDHRAYASRELFDAALGDAVASFRPDYILLAGFMRVLTDAFVQRFERRIVNIHPSLLPAFPGMHTHRQAMAAGVAWHGCTVHFVTPVLDHGPIIAQAAVPVEAHDSEETLAQRVLQVEHPLYARAARWLAQGSVSLDGQGRVSITGNPMRSFWLAADEGRIAPGEQE